MSRTSLRLSVLDAPLGATIFDVAPAFAGLRVVPLTALRAEGAAIPPFRSEGGAEPATLRSWLMGSRRPPACASFIPAWCPGDFRSGNVRSSPFWEEVLAEHPQRGRILSWVRTGVRYRDFARPFSGAFAGRAFDAEPLPPPFSAPNHPPVRPGGPFHAFAAGEVAAGLRSGSMRLWGGVGACPPPHCVHPLGVEESKPRLIYDARFGNCWTPSPPVSLDSVMDLARASGVGAEPLFTTWDHKSGYFHVALHPDSQTFFGFEFDGRYFVYTVLPFGWSPSAFVYQSLATAVGAFERRALALVAFHYLDDAAALSLGGRPAGLRVRALRAGLQFLLGFFISPKSAWEPLPAHRWLGLLVDLQLRTFSIPEDKLGAFLALVSVALSTGSVLLPTLRRIAGKAISYALAVPGAGLYARPLFDAVNSALSDSRLDVRVVGPLRTALEQWAGLRAVHGRVQWRSEQHIQASLRLTTDASGLGWGAELFLLDSAGAPVGEALLAGDLWSSDQRVGLHINSLEFLAFPASLRALLPPEIRNTAVRVGCDNQVAVSFLSLRRAARDPVALAAQKDLLELSIGRNLAILPFWLPGAANLVADPVSRAGAANEETLARPLFLRAQAWSGALFSVDAMASVANAQCPRFISRFRSAAAVGADVFSFPLRTEEWVYCFPPHPLLSAVVAYLAEARSRGVLIVPFDLEAPWWGMLVGFPYLPLASLGARDALSVPRAHGPASAIALRVPLAAVRFDFSRGKPA